MPVTRSSLDARRQFRHQVGGSTSSSCGRLASLRADFEQPHELRIPGFDAVLQIHSQHADVQRLDDIFAEILEALDLRGFLLERVVEPGIFDRDGRRNCRW